MPIYDDLREFMEMLEEKNQLVRVSRQVDPVLEINAIVDRLARKQGPAVLFENVKGSDMPVLGNLFGSHQRVAWTLGAEDLYAHVQKKIAEAMAPPEGEGASDVEGAVRKSFMYAPVADRILPFRPLLRTLPQEVSEAPCKEVVYQGGDIDINRFPLTKLWPQDGGRFITMPMVITRDPETGEINAGTYRMMYLGKNRTCMHWLPKKHGNIHCQKAEAMGRDLPVVVAVGCDPSFELSGCYPLHYPMDEFIVTGVLKGRGVKVIKADLSDLPVPAGSEVVLEGVIPAGLRATEGPFGEFNGYYSPPKETHVFEIRRITTRKDPIWHMATTGRPFTEIHYMSKATERLGKGLLAMQKSGLVDVNMAKEGASLYLMVASIRKDRPYHAREIIEQVWQEKGQAEFVTNVIVVDHDIDVNNLSEVMWAFCMNVRADQDLMISDRREQDLEHPGLSPRGEGARLGIDATRKWKEENYTRERPDIVTMDEGILKKVMENWERDGLDG
jgi:4-hydroxy-3-polyprenylbenzoate decarboxylase